jgi:S-formylglutathione hydrolase FrmB
VHGWEWWAGLSLIHGRLHDLVIATAVLGLLLLALRRDRSWWARRVPIAVAAAALLLALVWLYMQVAKPWPDGLPPAVIAWIGVGLLGVTLLGVGWGGQRWWVRVPAVGAAVLVVLGAAVGVDTEYGSFPTVGTALQLPPYDNANPATVLGTAAPMTTAPVHGMPLSQIWQPPSDVPPHGVVTQVSVPSTRSGFSARPAWVYLPPAYLSSNRPVLPVLFLIGGQPGSPRDWLDGGRLAHRMDDWARAHGGLAPVVVMPDSLGSELANPLCMDSALGRADTYLTQDVVAWVTSTLQVDTDHAHWAVGGFSYGGTCALQLAVAHPDLFPTFWDVSGQQGPSLGDRARTVAATFHGDQAAFDAVDPMKELARRRFPGSAAFIDVGAQDRDYRPQALAVAAAARAAGMAVTYQELPGRHNWEVWGPGFDVATPWLMSRLGLTP